MKAVSGAAAPPTSQEALGCAKRHAGTRRFVGILLVMSLGLAVSMVLATGMGRMPVTWETIGGVILGKLGLAPAVADRTTEVVVWGLRLSRVVLAALVGGLLALAGTVFQGLLLNPLADPFTIGVSTGAAFGVALLVLVGAGGSYWGLSPLPLGALAGALAGVSLAWNLSRSIVELNVPIQSVAGAG